MTLDAADRIDVQRIAQQIASETVRNITRGTGGAIIAVPVFRPGIVVALSQPGASVMVIPDGDETAVPAVNATGFTLVSGDRVLVEWNPPQGVYVTNVLHSQGGGEWVPSIVGSGSADVGWTKTGHWSSINRRVRVWGRLSFGSGSAVGTGLGIGNLPFPVRSDGDPADAAIGFCFITDVSVPAWYFGVWVVAEGLIGGNVVVPSLFATPGYPRMVPLADAGAFTWAAGDTIVYNLTYDTD